MNLTAFVFKKLLHNRFFTKLSVFSSVQLRAKTLCKQKFCVILYRKNKQKTNE